jgi:hypothetical protein
MSEVVHTSVGAATPIGDPGGLNLILVVNRAGDLRRFIVNSVMFAQISTVFSRMILGAQLPFMGDPRSPRILRMLNDDPDAVETVLRIATHSFDITRPGNCTLQHLFDVTVLSNKYNLVGLLRPHANE